MGERKNVVGKEKNHRGWIACAATWTVDETQLLSRTAPLLLSILGRMWISSARKEVRTRPEGHALRTMNSDSHDHFATLFRNSPGLALPPPHPPEHLSSHSLPWLPSPLPSRPLQPPRLP